MCRVSVEHCSLWLLYLCVRVANKRAEASAPGQKGAAKFVVCDKIKCKLTKTSVSADCACVCVPKSRQRKVFKNNKTHFRKCINWWLCQRALSQGIPLQRQAQIVCVIHRTWQHTKTTTTTTATSTSATPTTACAHARQSEKRERESALGQLLFVQAQWRKLLKLPKPLLIANFCLIAEHSLSL